MRYTDLYVSGTGSWLPPLVPVQVVEVEPDHPPVGEGVPADRAARIGMESVAVCTDEAPPQMAVRAADSALRRAGTAPSRIALVLHAYSNYQGHDNWSAAAYISRMSVLGGNPSTAIEVRQMANGGMAALELAAAYLAADGRRGGALLTAADRFALPMYDRWRSNPDVVLGDGAGALLLDRRAGFAQVTSVLSWSEPMLEGIHRGDDPFGLIPSSVRRPVDMDVVHRAFTARLGADNALRLAQEGRRAVVRAALEEAGWRLSDVDWFVVGHFGWRRLKRDFLEPFGIDPEATTWAWARRVGHLGPADQIAGLDHLASTGRLRAGQRCLLIGAAPDLIWSCATLEVLRTPDWSTVADEQSDQDSSTGPRPPGRTVGSGPAASPGDGSDRC